MCNLTREEKTIAGENFDKSLKENHNLWNFVYFYYKLVHTPISKLSCHEIYIHDMLASGNLDIFPKNRTANYSTNSPLMPTYVTPVTSIVKIEDPPYLEDLKVKVNQLDEWKGKLQKWTETHTETISKGHLEQVNKLENLKKEIAEVTTSNFTLFFPFSL